MRTKKAITASALAIPLLALGGGIAYASTTSGSPPPATRPAVTSTVAPAAHRCDDRCDRHGHGYRQQVTLRQATRQQATGPSGCRHDDGLHSRDHLGSNGQYRSDSQWGDGYHGDCR